MNHWRGGYKRNYSFLIIPACFPLFTAVPPQPTAIRELQDISFSEKNSHIASKMFADDPLLGEISKLILVLVTNTHALPLFYIYDWLSARKPPDLSNHQNTIRFSFVSRNFLIPFTAAWIKGEHLQAAMSNSFELLTLSSFMPVSLFSPFFFITFLISVCKFYNLCSVDPKVIVGIPALIQITNYICSNFLHNFRRRSCFWMFWFPNHIKLQNICNCR